MITTNLVIFSSQFKKNTLDDHHNEVLINNTNGLREKLSSPSFLKSGLKFDPIFSSGPMRFYRYKIGQTRYFLFQETRNFDDGFSVDVYYILNGILRCNFDDYAAFYKYNLKEWENGGWYTPADRKNIENTISKTHNEYISSLKLPEINDESLIAWLEKPDIHFNPKETDVYESKEWVDRIKKIDFLDTLHKHITDIADYCETGNLAAGCKVHTPAGKYIKFETAIVNVYYRIFHNIKVKNQVKCIIYLKDFCRKSECCEAEFLDEMTFDEHIEKLDDIASISYKAYPLYILADMDIWKKVEKDNINIALSSEEQKMLSEIKFPAFINGRAGSGKSTMLFYLFAEFLNMKIFRDDLASNPYDILYLTYSSNLKNMAHGTINDILYDKAVKNYPKLNERFNNKYALKNHISKFFFTFRNFLLNYLTDEEKNEFFSDSNYISYNYFEELYLNNVHSKAACNLASKKVPPEVLWHVIRTYIKGYDDSDFLTPDKYSSIDAKEISVEAETYRNAYDIWDRWYRLLNKNYKLWDDQDLVRYVLNNKLDKKSSRYSVLFCDEAQDFTRTEINFLLKSSAFFGYDLSKVENIPFAFAGDPLQTINPTGFRWGALTHYFHSLFVDKMKAAVQVNPAELSSNYRSSSEIVKFSNLIQAIRKGIISESIKPQLAWRKENEDSINMPLLFVTGVNIEPEEFIKNAQNTYIIVPYSDETENALLDKIKNDDILKKLSPKSEYCLNNVFTANKIKGIEKEKIIIYKFGDYFIKNCPDLISGFMDKLSSNKISETDRIKFSYFFNKLYVAVTRAREKLYIVDTKVAYDKFWKYMIFESPEYENLMARISVIVSDSTFKESWKNNLMPIRMGDREDFKDIEEKSPEVLAEELYEKGQQLKESYYLSKAAGYYNKAGDKIGEKRAKAYSYKFRKEFEKAGHLFKDLDSVESLRCYWMGKCWKEICDNLETFKHNDDLKIKSAKFMHELNKDSLMNLLSSIKNDSEKFLMECGFNTILWKNVMIAAADFILAKCDSPDELFTHFSSAERESISSALQIANKTYGETASIRNVLGMYSFANNQYLEASEYWQYFDGPDFEKFKFKNLFYYCQARLSNRLIDKINNFSAGKFYDKVHEIERENKDTNDTVLMKAFGDFFINTQEFAEAFKYYKKAAYPAGCVAVLQKIKNNSDFENSFYNYFMETFDMYASDIKYNREMLNLFHITDDAVVLEMLLLKIIAKGQTNVTSEPVLNKVEDFEILFDSVLKHNRALFYKPNIFKKFSKLLKTRFTPCNNFNDIINFLSDIAINHYGKDVTSYFSMIIEILFVKNKRKEWESPMMSGPVSDQWLIENTVSLVEEIINKKAYYNVYELLIRLQNQNESVYRKVAAHGFAGAGKTINETSKVNADMASFDEIKFLDTNEKSDKKLLDDMGKYLVDAYYNLSFEKLRFNNETMNEMNRIAFSKISDFKSLRQLYDHVFELLIESKNYVKAVKLLFTLFNFKKKQSFFSSFKIDSNKATEYMSSVIKDDVRSKIEIIVEAIIKSDNPQIITREFESDYEINKFIAGEFDLHAYILKNIDRIDQILRISEFIGRPYYEPVSKVLDKLLNETKVQFTRKQKEKLEKSKSEIDLKIIETDFNNLTKVNENDDKFESNLSSVKKNLNQIISMLEKLITKKNQLVAKFIDRVMKFRNRDKIFTVDEIKLLKKIMSDITVNVISKNISKFVKFENEKEFKFLMMDSPNESEQRIKINHANHDFYLIIRITETELKSISVNLTGDVRINLEHDGNAKSQDMEIKPMKSSGALSYVLGPLTAEYANRPSSHWIIKHERDKKMKIMYEEFKK